MSYPCDQTDCLIHPVYKENEKNIVVNNDFFTPFSIIRSSIGCIKIPCLNENIAFECFLCQYLNRIDIKSNLIASTAKNVLKE